MKTFISSFQSQIEYEMTFGQSLSDWRPLIKVDKSPICEFLNGTKNNPGIKWILSLAADSIPKGVLHPCPYFVKLI